eukprot:1762283-Amphidinium_carterae.1
MRQMVVAGVDAKGVVCNAQRTCEMSDHGCLAWRHEWCRLTRVGRLALGETKLHGIPELRQYVLVVSAQRGNAHASAQWTARGAWNGICSAAGAY